MIKIQSLVFLLVICICSSFFNVNSAPTLAAIPTTTRTTPITTTRTTTRLTTRTTTPRPCQMRVNNINVQYRVRGTSSSFSLTSVGVDNDNDYVPGIIDGTVNPYNFWVSVALLETPTSTPTDVFICSYNVRSNPRGSVRNYKVVKANNGFSLVNMLQLAPNGITTSTISVTGNTSFACLFSVNNPNFPSLTLPRPYVLIAYSGGAIPTTDCGISGAEYPGNYADVSGYAC